jgi:hypothetical protein
MRTTLIALSLLAVSFAASACKTTACASCTDAQALVERVASENPSVTRLTVHCAAMGAAGPVACASTARDKKGKPSDAEDLEAMKSGKTVVLEEGGALDVTVPIMTKDGKHTMACGVTLKNEGGRDQVVAKATAIARQVEAGLTACGASCCCCNK